MQEIMELHRKHNRAMIYYDFNAALNEYMESLRLTFGIEAPCHTTTFRFHETYCRGEKCCTVLFHLCIFRMEGRCCQTHYSLHNP